MLTSGWSCWFRSSNRPWGLWIIFNFRSDICCHWRQSSTWRITTRPICSRGIRNNWIRWRPYFWFKSGSSVKRLWCSAITNMTGWTGIACGGIGRRSWFFATFHKVLLYYNVFSFSANTSRRFKVVPGGQQVCRIRISLPSGFSGDK